MKIYEYSYYQEVIKAYIDEQELLKNKVSYQQIALSLRMQKSYFSKVMAKNAELNKDQAFLLGQFLKLTPEETDYLFLLTDWARASDSNLKTYLKEKIKNIQFQKIQSHKYLNTNEAKPNSELLNKYYLSPEVQLIHLSAGIKRFQREPDNIRKELNLSPNIFKETLKLLQELELIELKENKLKILKSNLHLKPDSPFFPSWQTQFKLKSTEWIKSLEEGDKYNFLATFSSTEEDKEKIRIEFLHFLKKVEKIVKDSPPEKLYQINFDLFKWL